MSKRTRVLATVMAAMAMTTAFVGCGSSSSSEKKSITVWSHLSKDEVPQIRKVAEKWGKDNNVDVKVVLDEGKAQDDIPAMRSSKGPDLIFGLADDNLGTIQKAGLLEKVPSNYGVKDSEYVSTQATEACTINGERYAVPLAVESVALFYNKDKVSAPTTMEEVRDSGKFEYKAFDFYLSYGFLSANGGYVFKSSNGTINKKDVGLGNDGATKGYEFIKSLADKGEVSASITDDIAKQDFKDGKTYYYLSGPWNVSDVITSVKNLGIVPIPTLNGKTVKPFVGVQTAFVNTKSKNKDLSWKLLKYLQKNTTDILIKTGNRLPALKTAAESSEFTSNEYAQQFLKASKVGDIMPNIPAVQAMWQPGADNLTALVSGTQTAAETASKMKQQVAEGISTNGY